MIRNPWIAMMQHTALRVSCVVPSEVDHSQNWNLVGLPLEVEDSNYQTLFPESTEGTLYSYNGEQYVLGEELQMGNGYWIHFENEGTTDTKGKI
jgi:hypothetical protein